MNAEDLRFPIGRFTKLESLSPELRERAIREIEAAPAALRRAVAGLTDAQLDTPYREGGWTVRQVAHHVPDSHMNAVIRMKLALTEDNPIIRPYDQDRWARLGDTTAPVEASLALLEGVHRRWVQLLRTLSEADFARPYRHPDDGPMRVDQLVALYAWHGKHHTGHITGLRERMGW